MFNVSILLSLENPSPVRAAGERGAGERAPEQIASGFGPALTVFFYLSFAICCSWTLSMFLLYEL